MNMELLYFGINTYTSGIFRAWGSMADGDCILIGNFTFFIVCFFFY